MNELMFTGFVLLSVTLLLLTTTLVVMSDRLLVKKYYLRSILAVYIIALFSIYIQLVIFLAGLS